MKELLEKYIKETGLTKAQIARNLGIDYATLHRWLKDPYKKFASIEHFQQIISSGNTKFRKATVEDLVKELDARGFVVSLTLKV